jgi:hypothetical protein
MPTLVETAQEEDRQCQLAADNNADDNAQPNVFNQEQRAQQAATLEGIVALQRQQLADGAAGGAAAAAANGDQMMEMMRLISLMTLSQHHSQQLMLQRQTA